ncbi:hypothetical protein ACJMK2_027186 [Sinanodonta woodiana]|uniref:CRAL-TRIO domain-containing protein n=1 Tax=Sinanodonta woodiana TaxID=1069815 RepID=A0ABD3XLY3_SINWO
MDEYLTYTKRRLSELETIDKVHVVLGNESCDLDSAVAALTYAFYLHHKSVKDPGVLYLPVLNITSDQYRLRTETVYFLGRLNIKQTDLTFRDDVDLQTLKAIGKLDLTLVDHNVLVVHDQSLEDIVTTVIDHRTRDRQEQAGVRVVIDLVGSCCTLIAEELLSDPDFNLNHQVALLLYGTILIDTVNRSVAAGKLTQRDEAVLQRLEGVLQDVNGDQLYEDIQMAKCDLSGLTTMEILEKDIKMVSGTSMTVAMSSVSVDIQELLSRDGLTSDLETFCQQMGCPVLVVMSITVADEDNTNRQLAVFSTNRIFREQICDVLDLSTNPNLQLEPVAVSLENISIFRQGNVKASRKKVLPVIKAFLNGDKTPDITSKEFASETQQAAAKVTEGFSSFSNLLDTNINTTSKQNQSFFTESNETNKQLFSKDDFDPFGAMNIDDIPVKERQSMNLVTDSFDPFASSSMQNQSEDESYFTVSNETQFSDADFNPYDGLSNDDKPIKEEHDTNLVDIQNFDPFKTISNSESNEWQSGSEVGSLDPWSSSGKSESVLKQSDSGLYYFDTFTDPVQNQSVAAEHPATSYSTPVQSKAQMDDFELMTPKSLKEEAVSQSEISDHVELVNLDQDHSTSDRTLSADTNQPLLDYRLFDVGGSSGEDLKNSWENPFLASQEVSFTDNAQLSPHESVNVSDLFKNNNLESLKFDKYRGGSHTAQDDREKYGNVCDSLELNEADFFDQINTPDYQSGVSTPLINSGISTPFESLHANHSGRNSESESGYPTITHTPPHSFTESGMANLNKDHVLPSFNSSEMVERIHKKKASLHGATEINFNSNSVPYTPQNSFIEGTFDAFMIDRDLPSFDNSEFVQKIHEKRSSLAGIHEDDMDSEASQYPYAPHNSFIGGTFDKYAQENLSSMNDAETVKNVREKQAALSFFSGSDNQFFQKESLQTESPSFGSVESNNPFLVNVESDASSSTNPFLFMDDGLLSMQEFISPFTPQTNASESNLHFMENRDSSIESELTETHSKKLPLIMDDENFENVAAQNPFFENFENAAAQNPTFENFENVAAQNPTFENFENVAAQNPTFENFENVAAQNPFFENFEENLNSMQNEGEKIEKNACETDSLDSKFTEQEGHGEYELKEKSLKEESIDSQLFKDDLVYIETGKEDDLYSGFKCAANTSILDEDDIRLREISNIWGQDIQQQDVVNNDHLDSVNLHVTTGTSKPDELDEEYQLIEYSNAQTEASSDTDKKLEIECDTRSEEDLLGGRETEEIQEIAYSITGEIIQTVLDNFPDLHIPIEAKTLQEVESKVLEEGSESPNKSEGESIFSLETEYLPNMDPLGGNMELVTSPSISAQDQDKEFGDVETASFHRASHEECHADSLYQGDTAHSATSLSDGLPSVPEVIIEASQVSENETLDFVPHKLGSDHIPHQHVVSSDMTSLSRATAVNLESSEKVNEDMLVMNIEQTKALEKQNVDSCEPDLDLILPEVSVSASFVPATNIEIVQQLDSETQNLVTQQPDMESVSHQPDSEWISVKPSSDLLLSQAISEDILSLSHDAGDGFASNIMISADQSVGTGFNNVQHDDYEADEQNSFPDGSVLESFRTDLITNETEVSGEKSASEIESIMNEKMLDLAGNIVNSVLANAIECTLGGIMKSNVKRHVVSEESVDFSPVSTSLEDDVIEFASETEIDHIETLLETEVSCIGAAGEKKIFRTESAFDTDIPDKEIQYEKEMSQSTQAAYEDTVQTSEADGEIRHDPSDSEDSDTSSTTTEGSYRIEDPGVTFPPEMLYDTMDTLEISGLGQETPANYLLAEEVIDKGNIPDLVTSVGYSYTSKTDELCHMSELQDISGVPDIADKYAVTEIVNNSDLLEKQDYSSLIDLDNISSNQHSEISSDSQTGTNIKEIWELQDQTGYIVEPYVRQTAEKDEKVQTWDGFEESVADTQNSNNSALVVGPKQDEIESLSAYHTTEKSKEEDTVPDLMTLVHKKEKLKGGYSFDLPIPFVIIQEAADDLPSEEESPSPPSAGKKSSNMADNATQTNKSTATETVKHECENLIDIALTYSVSHESDLTGRKQREDDAFLFKDDSTVGLKSQHADDIPIEIMLEETHENVIEEVHSLQEGNVCKESVCLEMSASEIDAGSFDENRLGKDTDIQEKSVAVDVEITSFEQSKMDEEYTVTDYKTAQESGTFKSHSTDIVADSTGNDSEKTYDVETEAKSTEKNKTDEDNAFADLNPVEEHSASKMELSFKAAETTGNSSEKSFFPEIKSTEGNNMDQDNTIAAFQLAEESDYFRSQSTEMKVDSTCRDYEKSFTAEFRTKSPEEINISMNNTVAEFKLVEEPSASKSQPDITNADSKSKDSEKSLTAESETKSSAPTVEIISPEQNQMDVDSTFKDFKRSEESEVSESYLTMITPDNTDEEPERSYAVKLKTKPPHENAVDKDDAIEDVIIVEESERSYAVKVETKPPDENAVDEDDAIEDVITVEESERSYAFEVETKPPHETAEDENDAIADAIPVEESERSYAVKVETQPPHENAVDENDAIADGIPVEESERSYAVTVETKPPHGNAEDEDNFIAELIPVEEYDTPDSYSADIVVDSISKSIAKSYAAEEETKLQEKNEMDDFEHAEEFGPFTSQSNEISDYCASKDFKHAEELNAFKHQSAEIAVDSIGADFVDPVVQVKSSEGKQMNEDKKVSDFKPVREFVASHKKSFDNDNVTDITSEMFEKSNAAAVETISVMGENMDDNKMDVDFKSAEDFDAFQSQSAEVTAHSTYTHFENSFVLTDVKPLEEFDAVKMQPSYNAATSASEHFENSNAAEAETMSSQENTFDAGGTVTDLKSAEEFDIFRSQSTEITVNSTGTDSENSFAFADFKFGDELDVSKMQSSYNAIISTSKHFEKSLAAEAETMFTEESQMEEENAVVDIKLKEDTDALKSQLFEITVDSTGKDSEKSSVADGLIQSTQENKMDEDNLISNFILVEESNALERHSAEITADSSGKSSAKSFVADIETNSLEKHKIDEDNTSVDFQTANESEAFKSQSNEIVDFSTGKDFENSFAPEVQTTSPEGRQVDEDKIVADFKPMEELDASKRLSSDNVTESTHEHFKKSDAAEVEILFADEKKMEEDNTVADFKSAEEFVVFRRQLTEITADNRGTDLENSSVSDVESKLQEDKILTNETSPDFKKLSVVETENKSSVEEKMIEDITVTDQKLAQEYDASKSQSTEDKAENTSEDLNSSVSDLDDRSSVVLRKEVYMTTAGRMSIAIDSTYENMIPEPKEDMEKMTSISTVLEELQPAEPQEKSLKEVENKKRHKRETSVTSLESKEKMRGMDWTQEFYEDPIPGMEAEEVCDSSDDSQVGSSDSEDDDSKPGRPSSLFDERKAKRRIAADVNILNKDESTDDILDDPPTPDDLGDDLGELEWENDTPVTSPSEPLSSQFCARDDDDEERESHDKSQFRNVQIAGKEHRVDMGVIEPYKKVLSHGGYYGDGLNAIILFSGCYLPDRSRRDYQYVMDNLFLYVISTLELLVAEDYLIVYFHGATPRRQMPSFGWLKKCYQTIDRRLKKNLKTLLLVHPTLWLKTVVMMTKPFISSKFSSKLRFVKTLRELATIIPMEYIYVPEPVQVYDDRLRNSTSISTPSSSSSDNTTPR